MANNHIPRADGSTPAGALQNEFGNLVAQWQELGIDPDDFVRCAQCGEYTVEQDGSDRRCGCDRGELNVVNGVPVHGAQRRVRQMGPGKTPEGVLWNYSHANQPQPELSHADIKLDDGTIHHVKLWSRIG